MRRERRAPRADWIARCEDVGFAFHTIDGAPYWDESASYAFSLEQVECIEAAVEDLYARCLELVDWIVQTRRFEPFGLSKIAIDAITASWQRQDPSLYGRFDLSWDGVTGTPKLLEFNADTPTGLLEASVVQWFWLKDVDPSADQFNSIHEQLIERWRHAVPAGAHVHFAAIGDHDEDVGTTRYLMDTALQAGHAVTFVPIDQIGWHAGDGAFVDADGRRIEHLFKLYPWEWMWDEAFAEHVERSGTRFIEPPWKLLLSSKAMLPLLYERNRDHPNILPASFSDSLGRPSVRKPVYSREGANVALLLSTGELQTDGPYDERRSIHQAFAPLPCFSDRYPVIGAWVIGERAAGIGIREDDSPITRNSSRFVPHYFRNPR